MKKSLAVVLALVFSFSFAGVVFAAANPFVDVPAKHWAYDAVTKLAQAGILDGYGDGAYRGERLATRYEMAQATAKAMARADKADAQMKALIDKLVVEFAAELNNLGVRVAKLEKNASSIKFWGDSRLRMLSNPIGLPSNSAVADKTYWDQRLRVYAKADLNEKAAFYGRLMANWRDDSAAGKSYESTIYWDYGYFQWTFNPAFKVAVGRQSIAAAYDLFFTNGGYDAIQFMFGAPSDKFTAKVGYGDVGTYTSAGSPTTDNMAKPMIQLDATYKLSKDWSVNGAMYYSTDADSDAMTLSSAGTYTNGFPFQVYALSVKGNLSSDFTTRASYFWNSAKAVRDEAKNPDNTNATGWMADLWYKGADKAKVGTWGIGISYRDIKPWALEIPNTSGMLGNSMVDKSANYWGSKGWGFGANYTISKNAVLMATYENLSRNRNTPGSDDGSQQLFPFYYLRLDVGF